MLIFTSASSEWGIINTSDTSSAFNVFILQRNKNVNFSSANIQIDSGAALKLKGILDFGSSFNFGETDKGIEVQYRLSKKNKPEDCGILKVVGVNNHASNDLTVEGITIPAGQTGVIAQCSLLDMIKLVNYMKTNNKVLLNILKVNNLPPNQNLCIYPM